MKDVNKILAEAQELVNKFDSGTPSERCIISILLTELFIKGHQTVGPMQQVLAKEAGDDFRKNNV